MHSDTGLREGTEQVLIRKHEWLYTGKIQVKH